MNKRLDTEMLKRGLARSRSSAADMIKRGNVTVNGKTTDKASRIVLDSDDIKLISPERFVSRAGDKLDAALNEWKIDVKGSVALDVGSSTGGFTDCLLQRGADKVIAIDVGTSQLVESIKSDPRVETHESTDIRKFSLTPSQSPVDIAVVDVSFISLSLVLPKIFELIKGGGKAICLVKPQFEVGRELAQKRNGVIRDDDERLIVLQNIKEQAHKIGFKIHGHMNSPIEGENGNREFLLFLEKSV